MSGSVRGPIMVKDENSNVCTQKVSDDGESCLL